MGDLAGFCHDSWQCVMRFDHLLAVGRFNPYSAEMFL